MFLDQLIRPAEIAPFASSLRTHQLAKLAPTQAVKLADDAETEQGKKGAETVLDRAMMEHNVLACSRVYNNITFKGLGLLLDLRPSAAEQMARTMIQQGRLRASLDQVEELIVFDVETREGDGIVSNVAAAQANSGDGEDDELEEQASAPASRRFDLHIRQTLQATEMIASRCEALLAQAAAAKEVSTAA